MHENAELAAYFLNDFERLLGASEVLFSSQLSTGYAPETTDNANILLRAEVLKNLVHQKSQRLS